MKEKSIVESTDAELILLALNRWANELESGDANLSAVDAEAAGKKFKALNLDQMKTVIRLRELAVSMAG